MRKITLLCAIVLVYICAVSCNDNVTDLDKSIKTEELQNNDGDSIDPDGVDLDVSDWIDGKSAKSKSK